MWSILLGSNIGESSDYLVFCFCIICYDLGSDSRGWNEWVVENNTGIPTGPTCYVSIVGRIAFTLSGDFSKNSLLTEN